MKEVAVKMWQRSTGWAVVLTVSWWENHLWSPLIDFYIQCLFPFTKNTKTILFRGGHTTLRPDSLEEYKAGVEKVSQTPLWKFHTVLCESKSWKICKNLFCILQSLRQVLVCLTMHTVEYLDFDTKYTTNKTSWSEFCQAHKRFRTWNLYLNSQMT